MVSAHRYRIWAFRGLSFGFAFLAALLSGSARANHEDGRLLSSSTDWGVTSVPYWSSPNGFVDTSPGQVILAPNGAVDFFGMDYAVATGQTYLQFDLLIGGADWTGDDGPASFVLTTGGMDLFSHTLSVNSEFTQSFPTLGSPAGSGAISTTPDGGVYRLSFVFPSINDINSGIGGDVILQFRSSGPTSGSNPLFAIDNFIASGFPIPEPSAALLIGLGLVGLARCSATENEAPRL